MTSLLNKTVLKHPLIVGSFAIVALIAVGSFVYYQSATRVPATPNTSEATTTPSVTSTGEVVASENPDIAFENGGKVARIPVSVGQSVFQGETLAALDTATLTASRAEAVAAEASQQAKLDSMKAGARQVDIDAKQTALDAASQTLANDYANTLDIVRDSYGKAYGAVHTYSDTLYSNPDSSSPTLAFQSTDSQSANNLVNDRVAIGNELAVWKQELAALSDASSNTDRTQTLVRADAHLEVLRTYSNQLVEVLAHAIPNTNFNTASIASAYASADTLRDTISGLITAAQTQSQKIAGDTLAVQSAHNALDQTKAGSTPQDIAAQQAQVDAAAAQVASIDAQIAQSVITAPFDGTVASVQINVGDLVAPQTPAISLSPKSTLQVHTYVSATDVVHIANGAHAKVTLDAYGASRVFPATVTVVDHAPTMQQGIPAYKVTLQFDQNDPAITIGMNANVTIPTTQ